MRGTPHRVAVFPLEGHTPRPVHVQAPRKRHELARIEAWGRHAAGARGADQALDLGAQIASALAAAHKHVIVHRDLKPANIMLVKTGGAVQVKLLDFSLAKLRAQPAAVVGDMSALPTEGPATSPGAVLGTVPYMAPEPLEGKEADARTDLFAFGCVLHEMLCLWCRMAIEGRVELPHRWPVRPPSEPAGQ